MLKNPSKSTIICERFIVRIKLNLVIIISLFVHVINLFNSIFQKDKHTVIQYYIYNLIMNSTSVCKHQYN